ncbi:MAG: sugar phosphate isomerase/epimerase family protein [Bacteroidota bacterium]
MSPFRLNRRQMLRRLTGLVPMAGLPLGLLASQPGVNPENSLSISQKPLVNQGNFTYCLNTSTIMGQKLGLVQEIEIAAQAGYDGIEIWVRSLMQYQKEGGKLPDLKKRIEDLGIRVEDAIGFAPWIVENNDERSAGLEQAKQEMEVLAQIGCTRIAAPPAGATTGEKLDLYRVAERFRALVELGAQTGVMPQLEVWGFSYNLSRLSEVLFVAAECGHPSTRILPDVYHLYKGGSDPDGLKLLSRQTVEIFHLNDYPDKPGRAEIGDADRVYPGDGVAPIGEILRDLNDPAHPTILSLELFNRSYWEQDAMEVAKTGLQKMKAAVAQAFE